MGVPPRRRIPPAEGLIALEVCRAAGFASAPREALATAVRFTLEELATLAPGRSVEVRVPPFGATQCVPGPVHRRGTPASVVETDAVTWLSVAVGDLGWAEALDSGAVRASGERAALGEWVPFVARDWAAQTARPVADEAAQRLQNYSFNSQAGYLGLFGALMGALLGAVVFVVLDRRS